MTMTKICQRWFQFMGRLLGLALIHRYLIDAQEKSHPTQIPSVGAEAFLDGFEFLTLSKVCNPYL